MRRRTVGRFKSPLGFIRSSLTREVLRAFHGDKAQPSCWRETKGLSRCAFRFSSATWQTESGRSRTRAAGAPHVGGSSRSGLGVGGARSTRLQTVERREQLTCRGARLLQLGLAASSTRSVCPSSGLPGDASPALRPLEIDFCLRAIDSVSIDLWSRPIRERPAGRDLTGG